MEIAVYRGCDVCGEHLPRGGVVQEDKRLLCALCDSYYAKKRLADPPKPAPTPSPKPAPAAPAYVPDKPRQLSWGNFLLACFLIFVFVQIFKPTGGSKPTPASAPPKKPALTPKERNEYHDYIEDQRPQHWENPR